MGYLSPTLLKLLGPVLCVEPVELSEVAVDHEVFLVRRLQPSRPSPKTVGMKMNKRNGCYI